MTTLDKIPPGGNSFDFRGTDSITECLGLVQPFTKFLWEVFRDICMKPVSFSGSTRLSDPA